MADQTNLITDNFDQPDHAGNSEELEEHTAEVVMPKHFKIVQGVCLGLMGVVLALLVTFIIYISATWNKYRGNEYS